MNTFNITGNEQNDFEHDHVEGLVVDADISRPVSPSEQLRDLIYNAEGLSAEDKTALAKTAVNALTKIIAPQHPVVYQPRSASSHINRR